MNQKSLGLIEVYGLLAAVEAADTAMKTANVTLVGYEFAKGSGMTTVKIEGDVSAVKSAVTAAQTAVMKIGKVASVKVIPRPAAGIDKMVRNSETKGIDPPKGSAGQSGSKSSHASGSKGKASRKQPIQKEKNKQTTVKNQLNKTSSVNRNVKASTPVTKPDVNKNQVKKPDSQKQIIKPEENKDNTKKPESSKQESKPEDKKNQ